MRCAKTFHAPSLLVFFLCWKKKRKITRPFNIQCKFLKHVNRYKFWRNLEQTQLDAHDGFMEVFCSGAGSMLLWILFADPRTCTIGTLVSCLLVDAHCFTFYYYFVVVLVDESFMNVLKNRRIIAGSFRFWRFDSTKSSHKEEFFVVNGFKEQLNLLKRSIFIFELFLEKSSSFSYKNAWKLPLHRAKSFFDIAMSSQLKLITLKVSLATVL